MNAINEKPNASLLQTSNGWQYPANSQYPMDRDAQKAAGLIATTNRSIHGRIVNENHKASR